MSSFTTTRLVGSRVLVKGTDSFGTENQTVLDSEQWDEISAATQFNKATDAFDRAVEAFFAPIEEAAQQLSATLHKPEDPISFVVLEEGEEGREAQAPVVLHLNKDSIVLRLLENNEGDRLVWVGDELEVLDNSSIIDLPMQPETGAAMDQAVKLVTEELGGEVIHFD